MAKPVAIVLGGAVSHIGLIESLKNRGYYTIVIDYYEHPPAKNYCDEHIRESTLDKEKVLAIATERNVDMIITLCLEQPIRTACFVAEKLGLPAPYDYQTAISVTDKAIMKKLMLENGIPTSKFVIVSSKDNIDLSGLRFPVMVKPVDSTGSQGINRTNTIDAIPELVEEAIKVSLTGKAIVEEYCEGMEVSFDCFVKDGETFIIMSREQYKMDDRDADGMQSIGSITPANLSAEASANMYNIAKKVTEVFNLQTTPLLIQAIIDDEHINVIEIAARIGGGTHTHNIPNNTGFDILNRSLDYYCGIPISIEYSEPKLVYSTNMIYASDGMFDKITGLEEMKEKGLIKEYLIYKTRSMLIPKGISSKNRVGSFLTSETSRENLFKKIKEIVSNIDVLDTSGNSIHLKEVFIKESVDS